MGAGWLARAAFGLVLASAAVLTGFAGRASLAMVAVGRHHLIWVAVVPVTLLVLAAGAARRALAPAGAGAGMPVREVPPPERALVITNPRSGGGTVIRSGLTDKAEAAGAEVALLEGPGQADVADLARRAVAAGADLVGVAGGDGTQALVAGIAARHDLPFLVISAGTRDHFAMNLGLDRDNPAACLDALTSAGVEQRIGLGIIGDRTFVNNASSGAHAEVVQNPAYRDDTRGTTLQVLPDLLVSNDPYELADIARLGRRARLDTGTLGVVAVTVTSALHAVPLPRGTRGRGPTTLTAGEVVVDADQPEIPAGIDGETVMMPTPVRCTIRPQALRVRPHTPELDWAPLRQLASFRALPAGARSETPESEVHCGHRYGHFAGKNDPR